MGSLSLLFWILFIYWNSLCLYCRWKGRGGGGWYVETGPCDWGPGIVQPWLPDPWRGYYFVACSTRLLKDNEGPKNSSWAIFSADIVSVMTLRAGSQLESEMLGYARTTARRRHPVQIEHCLHIRHKRLQAPLTCQTDNNTTFP